MKPILVGLNNPHGRRPEHALFPLPVGASGHRLWSMVSAINGMSRGQYAESFDRRNLSPDMGDLPKKRLLHLGDQMVRSIPRGSTAILLGQQVRIAVSSQLSRPLDATLIIHPQERDGIVWRLIPHPSGRCLYYNDPVARTLVGMMLADVVSQGER